MSNDHILFASVDVSFISAFLISIELKREGLELFKVLLWSNSRYPFFFSYTTGLSKISCQISIYYEQYNSCFFSRYFREFTAAINFPFQVWVENCRKWRHFLKNTTRVEIIITITIAVRIRITKALPHKFVQLSTLIVIIISTRAVFLRKWRHFLQFSTQTWNKEN